MKINHSDEVKRMCDKVLAISKTPEELAKRLAMLSADMVLDDITYQPLPPEPEAIMRYNALNKDKKYKFDKDNPGWREFPTIKEWLDKRSKTMTENSSNVYWLKEWIRDVPDEERRDRLKAKLNEFSITTRQVSVEQQDKALFPVLKMFGGRVAED